MKVPKISLQRLCKDQRQGKGMSYCLNSPQAAYSQASHESIPNLM